VPRSAFTAVLRQSDDQADRDLRSVPPEERVQRGATLDARDTHGLIALRPRTRPLPQSVACAPAVAQRQVRVALLVEEEGLERGAITRIAGWLGVSPSTIGRDVKALLAAGDPVVVAAAERAQRRRANGSIGSVL
jgi:hypothetical protein